MAEKVGVYNNLWISPGAADSGTYAELEFLEGTQLGLAEQFVNARGMNGSRVELAARTRRGTRQVQRYGARGSGTGADAGCVCSL